MRSRTTTETMESQSQTKEQLVFQKTVEKELIAFVGIQRRKL